MGKRLAALHEWVDNLAHGKRIKNYYAIYTSSMIGLDVYQSKKELANWWGSPSPHDPRWMRQDRQEHCRAVGGRHCQEGGERPRRNRPYSRPVQPDGSKG